MTEQEENRQLSPSPRTVKIQIDTEQVGDGVDETIYVSATLKVEAGRVTKEVDPDGEAVIIFDSRKEAEEAILAAGFLPKYDKVRNR